MPDSVEGYLERLAAALAPLPGPDRREIVAETRSHVEERYATLGEPERVHALVEELGPPEAYAGEFLENYPEAGAPEPVSRSSRAWRWTGSFAAAIAFVAAFAVLLWAAFLFLVAPAPPAWMTWAEVTLGGVHVLAVLTSIVGLALAGVGEWLRRKARRR